MGQPPGLPLDPGTGRRNVGGGRDRRRARKPRRATPVVLRLSQLKRVLGIDIPQQRVRQILTDLGNREVRADDHKIEVVPPSWRADLTREIDLVEEVARIHGYDEIPEDVSVPMAASARRREDHVLDRVRQVLVRRASTRR